MARPGSTRQASFAYNYCVDLSHARINRFSDGFFPSASSLQNSLPSCFSGFLQPSLYKRQLYHNLRDQMVSFFSTYIILFHFLDTLANCFITLHYLLFQFLKIYRLEKGHKVAVLCSHSLLVRLFSIPAVIPLFRDPLWGGLSLVPLITVTFLFLLFMWIFGCWCEENTGRHFKGFYFIKSIQHAKQ